MKKHSDIQQGTPEWHQIRKGKVTGTTLKALMSSRKDTREDAIYELIAERLTVGVESNDDYESPMARGNRLEPDAIAIFELETGKSVERIGFAEDDTNPMIANSPDGLVGEDEAVEAKCMGGKNHVKMWLTNQIPDEYYWQCVQYFVVNPKLQTLHFIGYNPDIPAHPLHIITMSRESVTEDMAKARVTQEEALKRVDELLATIIKL